MQQVSVQVRGVDDETNELIISVECPEGTIGCEAPVIKRDGKWSELEDNKDAIEIVQPHDPNYPDDISPGDRAKQVYRVIANTCWGDSPPLGQLVNLVQCLPIGFAALAPGPILVPLNTGPDASGDDLVPISKPLPGDVKVSIQSGSQRVRLWRDQHKASSYNSGQLMPETLYIEGVAVSQRPWDITLSFSNDQTQLGGKATVFEVDFGSSEIQRHNVRAAPIEWADESAALQWDATMRVNLGTYLTPVSRLASNEFEWTVDPSREITSSFLSLTEKDSEPDVDNILIYRLEARHQRHSHLSDRFILVVYPEATATAYENWRDNNQDLTWTDVLPPVYNALEEDNSDPEPDECDSWQSPERKTSHYHPGAEFEMRTEAIPIDNGSGTFGFFVDVYEQGHQAMYGQDGNLIPSGVGAGTADRAAPRVGQYGMHIDKDVKPYIWAAQLDANPVEGIKVYTDLSHPLMHRGANLDEYLRLRPVRAEPGSCQEQAETNQVTE